jgi:hypothetical protein
MNSPTCGKELCVFDACLPSCCSSCSLVLETGLLVRHRASRPANASRGTGGWIGVTCQAIGHVFDTI